MCYLVAQRYIVLIDVMTLFETKSIIFNINAAGLNVGSLTGALNERFALTKS